MRTTPKTPRRHHIVRLTTAALLLGLAAAVHAAPAAATDSADGDGEYEVLHSIFPTMFLDASIASRNAITRAPDRTLLNISVRRHTRDAQGRVGDEPAQAVVTGVATDLIGHRRELAFREIREPGAIYYLAEIHHADQEHWRFRIEAQPVGHDAARVIEFTQQLWFGQSR